MNDWVGTRFKWILPRTTVAESQEIANVAMVQKKRNLKDPICKRKKRNSQKVWSIENGFVF